MPVPLGTVSDTFQCLADRLSFYSVVLSGRMINGPYNSGITLSQMIGAYYHARTDTRSPSERRDGKAHHNTTGL